MSDPVRIGLIGLGEVAAVHLQAYRNTEAVRVASVCDVREDAAKRIAAATGAAAFTDYHALLAAGGIDLALVLAPARWHRPIVEAVAEAGVHVLSEKPLAISVDDARAMVGACARAGVKLFYGSCYRYLPAVLAARELIDQGALGEVRLLIERINGGNGVESWRELGPNHYPEGGPGGHGMGLVDHGIHLIDIFPWLVRSRIVSVAGRGQVSGAPPVNEFMHMRLSNGADAVLQYNMATFATDLPIKEPSSHSLGSSESDPLSAAGAWGSHATTIHIYGTRGSLRVRYYANDLCLFDAKGTSQIALHECHFPDHFRSQIEDCVRAIREDLPPPVSGEAGVTALEALSKVYGQSPAVDPESAGLDARTSAGKR